MRPTVTEQLRDTRRILNDVVLPHIADGYAAQIASLALTNLEMLEGAWAKVLPFLHWDNAGALALLASLRGEISPELASAVARAAGAPPCDPYDMQALQARNEALQTLVHRAIGECGPGGREAIRAHLLERTARYPLRPLLGRTSKTD